MILVADSGSTKTDWMMDGEIITENGINPVTMSEEDILSHIQMMADDTVSEIFFYGAGCVEPFSEKVRKALMQVFPQAHVQVESDLLGAARALCGREAGIACILGTGSNSCLYDGERIIDNIPPLGYILGDEGSASALGRVFISDYIKGLVPECVALAFEEKYDMSYASLVQKIYHGASPAGFLGSLAPDILAFYGENHYMTHLVDSNFRAFIDRSLKPLLSEKVPIGVVGSFGWACRSIISEIGKQEGVEFARFTASPSAGLIEYHKQA